SILYSAYSISPENPQFVAIDDVGCTYIEEIPITVRDTAATFNESGVCSGYVLPWLANNGEITILTGDNSAIEIEEENGFYKINSSTDGFFVFSFEDFECPYSATAELEFLAPDNPACLTSARNMRFSPNLTLIPNPARSKSRLEFELERSEELNLTIMSPGGRIIQNKVLQGVQGNNSFSLDLKKFASGYYLIMVKGESVQSTARLIVH
ncbi:MAG: T9SS type A sorting domain-containing protein, partial [Cryomorphaceae bacterium]